jgi:hypothetical protein
MLLGMELAASGPLSNGADWAMEMTYSGSARWMAEQDVTGWNAAFGADFVHVDVLRLALGPRLGFGYLGISSADPVDPRTERTLVTQLGARMELEAPIAERIVLQLTAGAQRTLGVYALGSYTGLDQALNGFVLSWGAGLGFEP